jgi:hypothetical protein
MWINPKFKDQAQLPAPPVERGQVLAVFPWGPTRNCGVCLATYEGRPYVSLRVWERGSDGQLWPVRLCYNGRRFC